MRLPTALYVFRGDESDFGPALSQFDYQRFLANLPFGKRLPNAICVHRTVDSDTGPDSVLVRDTPARRARVEGEDFPVTLFMSGCFSCVLVFRCGDEISRSNGPAK